MTTAITAKLDAQEFTPPCTRHTITASDCVRLRVGVVDVEIDSAIQGLAQEYDTLYRGYEPHRGGADVAVRVERGRSRYTLGSRFIVSAHGERKFSVKRIEEVLPHVEWAINWEVVRRLDSFLQLHAGVMERDGVGVVLPAAPGSGKTTLCAGLLARGWRFLSDEFALIDTDGMIHPYPKALCIKEGSFEVMQHLGLELIAPRRYRKGKKGRVAYVNPRAVRAHAIGTACPLRHVVFPKYESGAKPALESMTRGAAGFELAQLSFNLRMKGAEGMGVLMAALQNATCQRLVSGQIDDTCDLLEQYIEDH